MTTFQVPTYDEQLALVLALHRNMLPDHTVAQRSDNWARMAVLTGVTTDLHAHIRNRFEQAMEDGSEEEFLSRHGQNLGVDRAGSTGARGDDAGRIVGTPSSTFLEGTQLRSTNGTVYQLGESGVIPPSGIVDVDIVSTVGGERTNQEAKSVLRFLTPPAGIEEAVELQKALTGGTDREADGPYRDRVLEFKRRPPLGGAVPDYSKLVQSAESPVRVPRAYVYSGRNGNGSVDVAVLFDGTGTARSLTAGERSDLLSYMLPLLPVALGKGGLRVLESVGELASVEIEVQELPQEEFSRDWDDSTTLPEVLSWTPATRVLRLNVDRPANMSVGHRLVVAGETGEELVIESFTANADELVVAEPIPASFTFAATSRVYSGGNLVSSVRSAILATVNTLGPGVGSFGFGDWLGSLILPNLNKDVQTTTGVLDSTIISPVAAIEPTEFTFPDDQKIGYLIPGEILVHYQQ